MGRRERRGARRSEEGKDLLYCYLGWVKRGECLYFLIGGINRPVYNFCRLDLKMGEEERKVDTLCTTESIDLYLCVLVTEV